MSNLAMMTGAQRRQTIERAEETVSEEARYAAWLTEHPFRRRASLLRVEQRVLAQMSDAYVTVGHKGRVDREYLAGEFAPPPPRAPRFPEPRCDECGASAVYAHVKPWVSEEVELVVLACDECPDPGGYGIALEQWFADDEYRDHVAGKVNGLRAVAMVDARLYMPEWVDDQGRPPREAPG